MQSLTQPILLLKPFADEGDRNSIPVENTDAQNPQLADLTNGFPQITSEDPDDGGLPPERKDINGLGYLTTTYDYFYQAGGTFTFNQTISNAIGGYPLGARLWYVDNNGLASILRSTVGNNTNNFLTDSSVIGEVGSDKPWVIDRFRGLSSQYNLFDTKWSDYELNDQSWLRADTFSWQDGAIYYDAYNHLVADYNGASSQTETVGSYTITYYLATDGHKICLPNQETTIDNIYAESSVAWYYILDTTNQRFKLPRTKYGFIGLRDVVGKYVEESLPNIKGQGYAVNENSTLSGAFYDKNINATHTSGSFSLGEGKFDASRVSSAYQDNSPVQQRATQMYLYFYVGQFTQTATEQTAGLNASLFNGKADVDLSNAVSNASAYAKENIVGWAIPDYTAGIALSNNTTYTADKPYLIVQIASGNMATSLTINNTIFTNNTSGGTTSLGFVVYTGDEYKTSSSGSFIKYPLKGANNA